MIARITEALSTAFIAFAAVVEVVVMALADDSVRVTILLIMLVAVAAISPAALIISPVVPPTASPISLNPSAMSPRVFSSRCHFLIAFSLGDVCVFDAALFTALICALVLLISARSFWACSVSDESKALYSDSRDCNDASSSVFSSANLSLVLSVSSRIHSPACTSISAIAASRSASRLFLSPTVPASSILRS